MEKPSLSQFFGMNDLAVVEAVQGGDLEHYLIRQQTIHLNLPFSHLIILPCSIVHANFPDLPRKLEIPSSAEDFLANDCSRFFLSF